MNVNYSPSEENGLNQLCPDDLRVYSVGISTGGIAEMRMAEYSSRHIIATTIDERGIEFATAQIEAANLAGRVELKLEDAAEPLPYVDGYFDFVYARLVLHYLPKDKLIFALASLHRVLKPGGKLYTVVRSDRCDHAHMEDSTYDPLTELTEYTENDQDGNIFRLRRHFFSEEELAEYVQSAGFTVGHTSRYDERLYKDFMRTVLSDQTDNLVEVLAVK